MAIRLLAASQKLLMDAGIVPSHCTKVELVLPASGPMVLRFEKYVTTDDLDKLVVVFQTLASESKPVQD